MIARTSRLFQLTGVTAVVVVLAASSAIAQERQAFRLGTPGARANAMGRAFIGLADDATATVTNPAGLMLLTRPQAYVEFKTADTVEENEFFTSSSPAALSFFGVSAPIGTRFAAAFSRHQFYADDFEDDVDFSFEDRGVAYAGSVAMTVSPGLHVGASIGQYMLSSSDDFLDDQFDGTLGITLGGLWSPNEKVTLGLSGLMTGNSGDDEFTGESLRAVPSRAGVGVGFRPVPRAVIAFDVTWTGYSNLDSLVEGSDDATEVHLGGEYHLLTSGTTQLFARAGFFAVSGQDDEFSDEGGDNVGTFGAGLVLGRRLQIDFAVLSYGEAVISAAVRF